MYHLIKSWSKVGLSILLLLMVCSCDDIIIRDIDDGKGRGIKVGAKYKVSITTEPNGSRLVVESMGSRQVQSSVSPASFVYTPRPGMATVVIVSKSGYKTKKVRLTSGMNKLHVVLEKAPVNQFEFGGASAGGMGGMGRPTFEDIPGMGDSDGDVPEEDLLQ